MLAAGVIGCVSMILFGLVMVVFSFSYSNPAPRMVLGLIPIVIGIIMGVIMIVPKQNLTYTSNTSTQSLAYSSGLMESDFVNNFVRYSPNEMEHLVANLFEMKGYRISILARTRYDRGIDVEATNGSESIGIQVKHWSNNVDADAVVKTIGASVQYNKALIISTRTSFTRPAIQEAQKFPYKLELWDTNRFKTELRTYFGSEPSLGSSHGTMPKGWNPSDS